MLSMETVQTESLNFDTKEIIEEEGEILEDGEIDEEDIPEPVEEEVKEEENEEENSEEDEKKKHHKRSHHKRKKKREKDEEKKSRHKKRKGDDANEGGDSPSKKKKRRKKHSRKDRSSSSPDIETPNDYQTSHKSSLSPPLPSEQDTYSNYASYGSNTYADTEYSVYNPYSTQNNMMDNYGAYETNDYQQQQQNQPQEEYSSGSDSYYSDFESHLAQYKSYKKNSLTDKAENVNESKNGKEPDNDDYYSGYNNSQRQRRNNDSNTNRHDRNRGHKNSSSFERRRQSSTRNRRSNREEERKENEDEKTKSDKFSNSRNSRSRFDNNSSTNSKPKKNGELCQYYLAGHCHHGNNCTYMHEDYPCKYFHTGNCFSEATCRFSHDPPNDSTKDIIQKMKETFTAEDKKEREELEKAGIKPLQKPPPGHGLLPTPPSAVPGVTPGNQMSMPASGGTLKSLLDLDVSPTSDFQKKIDSGEIEKSPNKKSWKTGKLPLMPFNMFVSSIASITMTDEELEAHQVAIGMNNPLFDRPPPPVNMLPLPQGNGLLPTPMPPIMPPFPPPIVPHGPMMIPTPQMQAAARMTAITGGVTPPWIQRQQVMLQQQQQQPSSKNFYDNFYGNKNNSVGLLPTPNIAKEEPIAKTENIEKSQKQSSSPKVDQHPEDHHDDEEEEVIKEEEDIIRCHNDVIRQDDDVITESEPNVKAPDFLPAKQKALFMRINQKRTLSNEGKLSEDQSNGKGNSGDNWVYSSDEDENHSSRTKSKSSSAQSIIQMMSNKTKSNSNVDTNLLSKVANVINLPTSVSQSRSHESPKTMMSPPRQQPSHHRDRKSSTSSDVSPSHSSMKSPAHGHHTAIRRKLSSSELNKEPATIPLVAKQNVDSVHSTHPDPRITLSRLFGQKKMYFKGQLPPFSKDIVINGPSKLPGLKITLSSEGVKPEPTEKRDPRLARQALLNDPRVKIKPNDPRLRGRSSSITRNNSTTPNSKSSIIPQKPSALLVKPPSISAIPSLPELNLDLAKLSDRTPLKTPPITPPVPKPKPIIRSSEDVSSLPKLLRASHDSPLHKQEPTVVTSPKNEDKVSTPVVVAPYDPRFITSGASPNSTASTVSYDPRLSNNNKVTTTTTTPRTITPPLPTPKIPTPVLYDPRSSPDISKTMPSLSKTLPALPKLTPAPPRLTPAPGYVIKKVVQQNNANLPTGNQSDF